MTKHGKKYVEAEKQIPAEPVSPLAAMKLLKEISVANFDETVTGDFRLGIDTRQADQQLRGTVSLPNGSGKTVRVAVFAEGAAAQAAEEAGADIVGTDELMQQIQAGEFNFDAAVATLERQIRKNKTRLEKRLREGAFAPDPLFSEPVEEESDFQVVKSKTFPVKPLDVEEAILQMNMIGHQFYMFRNMATNEVNVVYRRNDGNYGLLEPDADE